MDDITLGLIAIVILSALINLGYLLYPNKEKYVSNISKIILYSPVAVIIIFIVLFAGVVVSIFSGNEISDTNIDAITVWGVMIALTALVISFIIEINNEKIFTYLDTKIDQISQNIITQINHLEESQKTLADQIQSLKDSIPAAEPSEEPQEGNDPADRKKVRTTKEYIIASFSGRCHKTGSK